MERYIGLCRAAGGVVLGTDSVLAEIRRGRVKFLLIASDASERTKKQLTDKCAFYQVTYYITEMDSAAMAKVMGKPCVAAAFNGKGPWKCVMEALTPKKEDRCDDRDDRKDD